MEIAGRVALVTGGGSGIGRATAVRLAQEGAAVAVADVDETGGGETAAQIEAQRGGRRTSAPTSAARPTFGR
jgi:NAD(P)-dependent dehydrogenase (short-subunit alcohol dehydrogenase family)